MFIDKDKLPNYSKGEEMMNVITHFVGFLFGIGVLIYLIVHNITNSLPFIYMLPYYVYGISLITVFLVSSLYHFQPQKSNSKAILRIVDHSDIYLLVAGTYTPICLYGVNNLEVGYVMLALEWILALAGILLVVFGLNNKIMNLISYIFYILGGWLLVFFFKFVDTSSLMFIFILIGGLFYTVGAICYAIGKKKKWIHSLFHLFILFGAVIQFVGLYFLLV